ncbi:MAG: aminotransferase class V-fold PLP-dependent enzyme [Verrucomicrobiales bacterium]|nr:aminotransferase class V-fold PLP-dependent enzyme [Verrucomicrobiales bacterium]
MTFLQRLDSDESFRKEQFPCLQDDRVFLAHAAIATVPKVVVDAMAEYNRASSTGELDYSELLIDRMNQARKSAAGIIGANAQEIALLGPTSLGLSLVANGIDFEPGDEVICYQDDYPANVYPWMDLERSHQTKTVFLKPDRPGEITPDLVADAISERTRLIALASCHFLTGYRIDVDSIGRRIRETSDRALFCLDAIQTVGAYPTTVEHVDFLSADSHKWMLGPMSAGIFYVSEKHLENLRPALLGAFNVKSTNFITRDRVEFENGARRYEPGVLNVQGILGMETAIKLLNETVGIDAVSSRLNELKELLVRRLLERDFEILGEASGANSSAITSVTHPDRDLIGDLYRKLLEKNVVTSFRPDRSGTPIIRFSHHFYNNEKDLDRVFEAIERAI